MRLQPLITSILVAVGIASCGENSPPSTQTQGSFTQAKAIESGSASPRGVRHEVPVPPKDAQWTLLCDTIDGPGHIDNAGYLKSRLVQSSGMPDWYIIHGDKESTIYYGYYRSLDDAAERQREEQDRRRICLLTDRLGNRLVRAGVLVAVNAPDPEAPSDWNLLNTPKNAFWTMEVASFSGNPKRKEAAVQAVRELREKGETEAYYYHGPTASSVCIGAWPREAVVEQGTGIDKDGKMRDDAHAQDPTQPLLVIADTVPPNLAHRINEPGTDRAMSVQAPKLEFQDPGMKKKVELYPYHYVNYELRTIANKGVSLPDPSVLVVIPRDQPGATDDDWQLLGGGRPIAQQPAPHRAFVRWR